MRKSCWNFSLEPLMKEHVWEEINSAEVTATSNSFDRSKKKTSEGDEELAFCIIINYCFHWTVLL